MLDKKYIDQLRDSINSSPIFTWMKEYRERYNLTCVVMDRLDTSVNYLNKHISLPNTEEGFLIFMMFVCMVVDVSKKLLQQYNVNCDDKFLNILDL